MTRIPVEVAVTIVVAASRGEVYQFFMDPDMWREVTPHVSHYRRIASNAAEWVLEPKSDAGLVYQARYELHMKGDTEEQHVSWRTIGEGTLDLEGEVRLSDIGAASTRVEYRELVMPDIPVSAILAKLISPLVRRETIAETRLFLDRVAARFSVAAESRQPAVR